MKYKNGSDGGELASPGKGQQCPELFQVVDGQATDKIFTDVRGGQAAQHGPIKQKCGNSLGGRVGGSSDHQVGAPGPADLTEERPGKGIAKVADYRHLLIISQ